MSFNVSKFEFTWNVTSFEDKTMELQLNFSNPSEISKTLIYDKFEMKIDETYPNLFM